MITIPAVPCVEGCSDCCCPVPFSKREWAAVPFGFKKGLDIRMSINLVGRLMVIPVRMGFLPPEVPKIIYQKDAGLIMRAGQSAETPDSCPFCVEHKCIIYEVRPLICRIHGTVRVNNPFDLHIRLTCPRDRAPKNPLSNQQIDDLYAGWLENKPTWQGAAQ